jgi:hypothetical protein
MTTLHAVVCNFAFLVVQVILVAPGNRWKERGAMRYVMAISPVFAMLFLTGCPCGMPGLGAQLVQSGELLYTLQGDWGLSATLSKTTPEDGDWALEGSFLFNMPATVLGPEVHVEPGEPETVSVTFTVLPSPNTEQGTRNVYEYPVSAKVHAGNNAVFDVRVVTPCSMLNQ